MHMIRLATGCGLVSVFAPLNAAPADASVAPSHQSDVPGRAGYQGVARAESHAANDSGVPPARNAGGRLAQ